MTRNARLMVLTILALFLMPLALVNADPLERFAENPIPYWEDDSTDVNVTWSAADQTVDFGAPYWRTEFDDVDGWTFGDETVSFVASGGYGTAVGAWDGGVDYIRVYTDLPNFVTGEYTVTIKWRANDTSGHNSFIRLYTEDAQGGTYTAISMGLGAAWDVISGACNTAIESIQIYFPMDSKDHEIYFDYLYIRSSSAVLDVGVPLEPGITQSVEFMGNFSALNSTVRFQMYDNATPSGLWCNVDSTQVTFPGAGDNGLSYALFSDVARINFSLDEERIIFKIYVSAQNMTLINCYSAYVGLANNDYLWMNDSVFAGSFELWYLQGDLGYLEDIVMTDNIFYLLFLSPEMWGYLGPFALVFIGYVLTRKDKFLGVLWFVVECLFVAQYLTLVDATPDYWWHTFILLLGGLFTCVYPLLDR